MEKDKVYTIEGIYNLKDSVEFISEIDRIQNEYKLPIVSMVLTSESDFLGLLEKRKFPDYHITYISKNSSMASLSLSVSKEESIINGKFSILKTDFPAVYLLVSHESGVNPTI